MSVSSAAPSAVPGANPGPDADSSLVDLPVGRPARVAGLQAGSDPESDELGLRLAELGFLPGESVTVVARAAFGGPLAVRIGDSTFALRRREAAVVRVRAGH
jgi:ferrous iron transport protein A